MLYNIIVAAFRSLKKRKGFTFMNVLGLSIGIASSFLIALFVQNEYSYDKYFQDNHRIYKLILKRNLADHTEVTPNVPHSIATVAVSDLAGIERATTLCGPFDEMISYKEGGIKNQNFLESGVFAADSNLFKILSFKVLKGNPNKMLAEPGMVVLTETIAKKYFGGNDPIGKSIEIGRDVFTVTGVCEDPPSNTQFSFTILTSINTIERFNLENFGRPDVHCYLKLKPNVNVELLEAKFSNLVKTYVAPEIERLNKTSWAAYLEAGNNYQYFLRALTSIHLDVENTGGMKPGGSVVAVRIMTAIGILIFIIACVNFINLATACSTERAREVGIRKVMGSRNKQLVLQFLMEAFLLTFISVLIAMAIVYFVLPYFNALIGKDIYFSFSIAEATVLFILLIVTGVLAGSYPAFVLSSFKPVAVLKGKIPINNSGVNWLRNGLVIFQFWISITLIICVLVMIQQIDYLKSKNLGFNKNQLLILQGDFHRKPEFTKTLINEIRQMPQVVSASGSLSMPSLKGIYEKKFKHAEAADVHSLSVMYVADEYAEVMEFELLDGRMFSEKFNDSLNIIVNESAVKTLGLKDPIGKTLTYIEQTYGTGEETNFVIVGVVKDFNFQPLHKNIAPLVLHSTEINFNRMSYIVTRLKNGSEVQALSSIAAKWKQHEPDKPFQFRFLDQVLNDHYKKEKSQSLIFIVFSCLSILVACIGLFGLSAYTAILRTKEIGIRKVNGATGFDIIRLLLTQYTKMVLLSFILAVPVAIIVMEKWWLQNFAFRIDISVFTITVSGAIGLMIVWLTAGYHTLKASSNNPIDVLRND